MFYILLFKSDVSLMMSLMEQISFLSALFNCSFFASEVIIQQHFTNGKHILTIKIISVLVLSSVSEYLNFFLRFLLFLIKFYNNCLLSCYFDAFFNTNVNKFCGKNVFNFLRIFFKNRPLFSCFHNFYFKISFSHPPR